MPFVNFFSAKPPLKLLVAFLSILACGIIVSFIGLLLGRVIFWMDLDQVNDVLFMHVERLSIGQIKYFQAIQTIGFFIVPGYFLYWFFSNDEQKYFNISTAPKYLSALLVIVVLIVSLPFLGWLIAYNQNIEIPSFMSGFGESVKAMDEHYNEYVGNLLLGKNIGSLLVNIIIIAVLPAIGEELIFRGVLQRLFIEATRNINMAIIITAILFSMVHGQFYGFIPRFVLGLFFGYLMLWSKTIWLPVLAHFINNALSVILYYIQTNYGGTKLLDSSVAPETYAIIISGAVTLGIVLLIKKLELKAQKS